MEEFSASLKRRIRITPPGQLKQVYEGLESACRRYIWVHKLHEEGMISIEDLGKERGKLKEVMELTKSYCRPYLNL
jgi:hypothetical protein